jgi:hypothetical protein
MKKFKLSISLIWWQKYVLDPLGLVFWMKSITTQTEENNLEWPKEFPIAIGIVRKVDYP